MYDNFMILLGKGMVLLILTGKENIQFFFFQLTEFGDTKIEKKKRERERKLNAAQMAQKLCPTPYP